jgi:hypothetical protein
MTDSNAWMERLYKKATVGPPLGCHEIIGPKHRHGTAAVMKTQMAAPETAGMTRNIWYNRRKILAWTDIGVKG